MGEESQRNAAGTVKENGPVKNQKTDRQTGSRYADKGAAEENRKRQSASGKSKNRKKGKSQKSGVDKPQKNPGQQIMKGNNQPEPEKKKEQKKPAETPAVQTKENSSQNGKSRYADKKESEQPRRKAEVKKQEGQKEAVAVPKRAKAVKPRKETPKVIVRKEVEQLQKKLEAFVTSEEQKAVTPPAAEPVSQAVQQENGQGSGKKSFNWKLAGGIAGGVIAAAYVGVGIYFGSHFYEETQIYGIDCSQKTAAEVKAEVSEKLQEYRLTLVERDNEQEYLTADEIGLNFEDDGSIDQMLKDQQSFIWPIRMFSENKEMEKTAFSYDKEKMTAVMKERNCFDLQTREEPVNAYIDINEDGYLIIPEIMGNTLDEFKTLKAVSEAIEEGAGSVSFEEMECYISPQVRQDDQEMNRKVEEMNQLVQANITLDFGEQKEIVDPSLLCKWVTEVSGGGYTIDDVKVEEYVASLAEKYDSYLKPHEFKNSYGSTVTLYYGDYGWQMDQPATMIRLMRAIEEGLQGTIEPIYSHTAMNPGTNDIGDTYVEICISDQRMFCYQDGVCMVDTPVVTGNPNRGNATPSNGVWEIDWKGQNVTLVGEGYRAPVDYWMPFNGGVGIHDLKSRAYFGGSIYLTNGSHGCVNTPYTAVQTIYSIVSAGTPVIVYD